jgi:hypothetical protein
LSYPTRVLKVFEARMSKGLHLVTLAAGLLLSACGGSASPTATNPAAPSASGYAGEWSGKTFQQQPISFTVSSEQKVTAASVGYVFDGCSGVETLSGLDQAITSSFTQFGSSLGDGRGIMITIVFLPGGAASGGVVFYGPPSCGSTGSGGPFTAARH